MITRREAILLGAGAVLSAGCGASGSRRTRTGSTLAGTWGDPGGTGTLQPGPGEPLIARTELGPVRAITGVIASLAHVTDAHVLDASSPARVPFLDRLGEPFESTFRPQETLTAQVLADATRAIAALGPDAVIQGGDLIDNDQRNELGWALTVLRGGVVGARRYHGVQLPANPDPFYYRPDLDAPRYPGLLRRAGRPFLAPGLRAPVHPVLGDHDILVAGELAPTDATRALALGDRALWELPPGMSLPPRTELTAGGSPDGPPLPGLVQRFLAQALAGPTVRVPPDRRRREMDPAEVTTLLRPGTRGSLDYRVDVRRNLRLIVLDLARRAGGSGGLVRPGQAGWLASQLEEAGGEVPTGGGTRVGDEVPTGTGTPTGGGARTGAGTGAGPRSRTGAGPRSRTGAEAGGRTGAGGPWVIVVSHQPLASSEGGEQLLSLLDSHPRVIAALAGHTHRNSIEPRGHYWLINTASLIDYPQQARALRILATTGGGVAIQTWMLDHTGSQLGAISRQLAYLDAQGGRPKRFAGGRLDRNVTLYRSPA